jgi:nucleoside-diphosphate-sugar epimerase
MAVLITGGSGFVGLAFVDASLPANEEVVAFSSGPPLWHYEASCRADRAAPRRGLRHRYAHHSHGATDPQSASMANAIGADESTIADLSQAFFAIVIGSG